MRHRVYRLLAYLSLGLGAAGVVLPLLPTTPFVLFAAWCASRGSPEFAHWLDTHHRYGPMVRNWRDNRAVPTRAKWLACLMLSISWVTLYMGGAHIGLLVFLAVFFCSLAAFLVSRPPR
ncbi:YbaN family protein [Marinobacter sp. X15-166B]|uniref:YbaN family protein n=1 Tax=Marinobacter sp. X15-166B TaxID=1897620 RepID=UPI00085CB48C|nr:YbaN family protein [Marinobacter sp. X15-166B]OEY65515.1 hypothetical protein BG841_02940 [Marinobacter sp. X15-166B]